MLHCLSPSHNPIQSCSTAWEYGGSQAVAGGSVGKGEVRLCGKGVGRVSGLLTSVVANSLAQKWWPPFGLSRSCPLLQPFPHPGMPTDCLLESDSPFGALAVSAAPGPGPRQCSWGMQFFSKWTLPVYTNSLFLGLQPVCNPYENLHCIAWPWNFLKSLDEGLCETACDV